MKNNTVVIGDTAYEITTAYKEGAFAMRRQVPWTACPYTGERRQQWEDGHVTESAGEHVRFGKDLLLQTRQGLMFRDDPKVVRTEYGVDMAWYRNALKESSLVVA